MSSDWVGFIGRQVGVWRLDTLIRSNDGRSDYLASDGVAQSWIQLVAADSPAAAGASQSWQTAAGLSHDHLIRLIETGEADLDGARYSFAAFEPPDDDISEIVAGRQLDLAEARTMVSAVAGALAYLHGLGLRHGTVTPSNMLIRGDAVKLSVDGVSAAGVDGREQDLKQLGQTLVRAMAGTADGARRLPTPFRDIAIGCLDAKGNGWTADTVLRVLEGEAVPLRDDEPAKRSEPGTQADWRSVLSHRWPVLAVIAAVVVVGLLAYRSISAPAAPAVRQAPVAAAAPENPKPARVEGPWVLIAATYGKFGLAKTRAEAIAAKAPKLEPRVAPAEGKGSRYYVLVGSAETRADAEKLRRIVRQQGAPRETYVTKLSFN